VVSLRRFTMDDVSAVTAACRDPEIPRWTAGISEPYDERDAREWIGRHDGFWSEGRRAAFAFCLASTGRLLGSMTLADIDLDARSAVAGYWAAPWARNRGATTRALDLVCRWGLVVLGLEAVQLVTIIGNVASERVAEKAGFHLVGTSDDYQVAGALDPDARYSVKRWVRRVGDLAAAASSTF
jgi:RimJ/RimL family protein N-acetyltransferase